MALGSHARTIVVSRAKGDMSLGERVGGVGVLTTK